MNKALVRAGLCAVAMSASAVAALTPATAATPATTYVVSGSAFRDANANGHHDAGEALRNTTIRFGGASKTYTAKTDASGRFLIHLRRGRYWADGAAGGWYVVGRSVVVTKSTSLSLRAVQPLGRVLAASIRFAKAQYRVGDTASIAVTLRNTGAKRLFGISATCDHVGDPNELQNSGRNWGALAWDKGITLPAHTTTTVHATAKIPAGAAQFGEVALACDFGYRGVAAGYRASDYATAKVPGESGAIAGNAYYVSDAKSHPLAKVRLVLVDPTTCPLVRHTATSNAAGNFRLTAPAGRHYKLFLYAPTGWKFNGTTGGEAFVLGHDTIHYSLKAVRGTQHVPAPPTKCA